MTDNKREYFSEYYKNNREKILKRNVEWRKKNLSKEKRNCYQKKWLLNWYRRHGKHYKEMFPQTNLRRKLKIRAIKYKGNKCQECGFNDLTRLEVFDFDHNGKIKNKELSKMFTSLRTWIITKKELDLCDLLCANCHRTRTIKRLAVKRE